MAEETAEEIQEETKLKTHTHVQRLKARTNDEFRAAIDDAAPVNYDINPQLAPAGLPSTLERMGIQPGESGGLLTRTDFEVANFAQK